MNAASDAIVLVVFGGVGLILAGAAILLLLDDLAQRRHQRDKEE